MAKYIKDGMVGVIVSPGYGAGWSSWAHDGLDAFLAMDKTLVSMKIDGKSENEVAEYIKSVHGDRYVYTGGWDKSKVEYLPEGTIFMIDEYDGYETITLTSDLSMTA